MTTGARVTCQELIRELPDFLDGEVGTARRAELEQHLEVCAHCLERSRFERSLLDRVKARLMAVELPPGLASRLQAAIIAAGRGSEKVGTDRMA